MKVVLRLGVSYSNENKLGQKSRETTQDVSSCRDPISVQVENHEDQNDQNKTKTNKNKPSPSNKK